jgi:PAS domain S-box-containing protein
MSQAKLLIVEDEFIVAADLQADLEARGYRVVGQTDSGEEALVLAVDRRPDLALMDIRLKGEMDGVETARRLRQELDIPVIFLTAYADDRQMEKVVVCEPLGYLIKPYESRELRAIVDISLYRMAMERRLKESKEQLDLAIKGTNAGLLDWQVQTGQIKLNERFTEIIGYTLEEIAPVKIQTWVDLCHPEDLKKSNERLAEHFAGRTDFYECETRLKHKNGSWVWVHNRGKVVERDVDGTPLRLTGTYIDITNKKRYEELVQVERDLGMALGRTHSLEETLSVCLETAIRAADMDCGGLYLMKEEDGSLDLIVHQGLSESFVRNAAHFPADSTNTRLVKKGEPIISRHKELLDGKNSPRSEEGLKAASIIPVLYQDRVIACLNLASHSQEVFSDDSLQMLEKIAQFIGAFIVRAQQEGKIHQSRQDLETLLNTIQDLVFILDLSGNIIHCNNTVGERLGFDREELIGKSVLTVHPKERHDEAKEVIAAMLAGKTENCLIPVMTKDGRLIPVETKVKKGWWGGREAIFGITRDITERIRTEEERLEWERHRLLAQKREGLGTMAGAVAHRFNNLLGAVLGNLELTLEDLAPGSGIRENLTQARMAAQQAADLSRLLLTYVGQAVPEKSLINLSGEVEGIMPLIEASRPGKVRLTSAFARDLPAVLADSDSILPIVVSLAANAWESMGEKGGEVRLSTGVAFFDESCFKQKTAGLPLSSGTYVYLEVSDTGSGMTEDVRSRMFDPFFSTKFPGRGLGLSTVWGLVRSFQGGITVVSEPGQGSKIRVMLPAAGGLGISEGPDPENKASGELPPGNRTILLAEDEEMVRRMAQTMLSRLGFRVLAAKDGEEALEIFRARTGEIDGVLCDLTMPGLSGWEVLEGVRALKPGEPVILSSGYEEAQVRDRNRKEQPQAFLHKPYSLAELRAALKKMGLGS